eukprot:CAMPEP_0184218178 /NCGR_PEP_ID=MMETSP0976-20121227/16556_1 /TAXON_ID=483370 /ORGANISM="non described non described, Strain CCMP2097" /LENGTH=315 /DNA_ID=CAMNT_0026522995 /DNA_START=52 /DNA_END=996 /DNA_ORIENTATION=+
MTVALTAANVPGGGEAGASGSVRLVFQGPKVCYTLTTTGTAPNRMHIHTGTAGNSGGVALTLFDELATPPIPAATEGCVDDPDGAIAGILADPTGHYVNIHSANAPNGAVRGQLKQSQKLSIALESAQVPDDAGAAGASGSVSLYVYPDEVCFGLATTGVTATSMHIHMGAAGASGDVTIAFEVVASDGTPITNGCAANTNGAIQLILQDPTAYYVNIHSTANPNGAIRGQMAAPATMMAMLQGSQVPEGGSETATGSIDIMYYKTQVCFMLTTDVTPTSMHIHMGAAGASGGVTIDFPQVASGGKSGCVDNTDG